jgi:predicted permease
MPGVQSVTYSTGTIGQLTWNTLVNVPGYTATGRLDDTVVRNIAGPRFIETLGLTLIAGRDFDLRDGGSAPATVIVNQSFARRFFHGDDVLGRQISFIDSSKRSDTIVGVVRDARDRGVHESTKPVVYSNYEKDPLGWITFSIRVHEDPNALLGQMASVFHSVDPAVPLDQPRTVVAQMDEALERERVLAALSAALGMLATVIAMVGLYGLLAFSVSRRTREIGIRIALGALPGQVRWLAVRESAVLLLGGALLGCPAYFAVARLLQAQVYQVKPQDPAVIAGAVCLLLVGGAIATLLPAWRSARVSPIQALKYD